MLAQHAPAPPPQPPQPKVEGKPPVDNFVRLLKERNRRREGRMVKAHTLPKSSGWLSKATAAAAPKRAPKWQPRPDPLRPPAPPGKPIKTSLC